MKTTSAVWGIALAAVFSATASQAAQVTLNTSVWLPPSHPTVAGIIVPLCEDIAKVTASRVRCNILPKAVTAPPQTFDAVRDGVADLSFIVDGYTPGRFVLSKVAEFPFLGNTAEEASVAYTRVFEKFFAQVDEHKGVKVIGVYTHGPGQLYTKKPITSLADLRGLKIRTGGGLVNDLFNAVGATGMFKAAPEVYELMSAGIIDGFVFPKETPNSLKLIPLFTHLTDFQGGLYNVSFSTIMNSGKWQQIAKDDQVAMQSLFGEKHARLAGKAWDTADSKSVSAMEKAGIKISAASPALISDIKSKIDHLEAEWTKAAKTKGVDGVAALKAMREELSKIASK